MQNSSTQHESEASPKNQNFSSSNKQNLNQITVRTNSAETPELCINLKKESQMKANDRFKLSRNGTKISNFQTF